MDLHALRNLQSLDTRIDQARNALARLAERSEHAQATAELARVRASRDDLRRSQAAMESELADIELKSADVDAHRARLEKQMKTVIAPREAEALQHEMATLSANRNELDDRGLVLLESSSDADAQLVELAASEEIAARAERVAAEALTVAESSIRSDIDGLSTERAALAATIDASHLAEYERRRTAHAGVAVTEIQHGHCNGCHMDLSVSELDAVKRLPADVDAECPNCSRLLVR